MTASLGIRVIHSSLADWRSMKKECRHARHSHFDANPDPACHFDADPDPACHFDADPDPTFHFDADPGPNPIFQIKAQNFEKGLK